MTKQLLLASAIFSLASPAAAQVAEVRLGANFHDIDWTGAGSGSDKERSGAINGEVVFEEPEFLKWALSPQPYVGGALNLGGETSYGGGGLLWRQTFAKNFYIDVSLGLVIHDGTIEVKPSAIVQSVIDDATVEDGLTPEQRAQFETDLADFRNRQQTEIDYGSRILFREQIALGYRWSDEWSTHVFVEHLSHGNILVSDRPNEGLDTLGVRASYHF
jgi:hypothetical protein